VQLNLSSDRRSVSGENRYLTMPRGLSAVFARSYESKYINYNQPFREIPHKIVRAVCRRRCSFFDWAAVCFESKRNEDQQDVQDGGNKFRAIPEESCPVS
jgi:hypothetical protein